MPSAANTKSEKPASSEATDNSPIRQVMTIMEHKIRNLEKRKSKLTSYRDLQKSGKELNADQKIAVAKYDEVAQTLDFARDLSKQITSIATLAEREAKKQAKREAWIRYASDTSKIREVLLVLDCLVQMGNTEAREDFLNGTNGAAKLTEQDLKILDDLYPEVTPKHEATEEGQPGFPIHIAKAAEHLYAIIDGRPKEMLGTTYSHIKEIMTTIHGCGYFEKGAGGGVADTAEVVALIQEEEVIEEAVEVTEPDVVYAPPAPLPIPPAPAVVPAPAYPLRPLPPITLQEVEHAYFAQQYPQQRPITEVIGSQNFFFLQDSEIDSPIGTPQPPPLMTQGSPPGPIPTQTFTNQHFVRVPDPTALPLPPHFPAHPHPEHTYPAGPLAQPLPPHALSPHLGPPLPPAPAAMPTLVSAEPQTQADERKVATPVDDKNDEEWKESRSPDNEESGDRKAQGQGDGQNRCRRYGGRGGGRGTTNGYRGRGGFRQNDGYQGRHGGEYQSRANKEGYQGRQYSDNYSHRHGKDGYHARGSSDGYYGNGDANEHQHENGTRDSHSYQGGFRSRGRGAPRGARPAPRAPRNHYPRNKQENAE